MEYCLVFCTCPVGDVAKSLAESLVRERLAACVNILPGLLSVYAWQGAVESSEETLLLIKTERAVYPRLESRLRELHPYELPEIVAIDIARGLPDYLNWISLWLSPASFL
jgi:periplasmic divalent cation tolerance protein